MMGAYFSLYVHKNLSESWDLNDKEMPPNEHPNEENLEKRMLAPQG